MICITAWRARIGCFCNSVVASSKQARQLRSRRGFPHETSEKHEASVTDILLAYVVLLYISAAFFALKNIVKTFFTDISLEVPFLSENVCKPTSCDFTPTYEQLSTTTTDISACVLPVAINLVFALWKLLLSHDVEENPGPRDQEHSLEETVEKLEKKFSSLENQISQVLTAVQSQADSLRAIVEGQTSLQHTMTKISEEVKETKEIAASNATAIKELYKKQEETDTLIMDLQNEIDRLESFSRRNNVKFFGIPETNGEDAASVIRDTLTTRLPEQTWPSDVIERAHRLGKPNPRNPHPRPIIAKFQRWGDAMRLMMDKRARDKMQEEGVRVAQDLTRRQSATLRALREEGKSGYYLKGQLHVKDHRHPSTDRAPSQPSMTRPTSTHRDDTRNSRADTRQEQPMGAERKRNTTADLPSDPNARPRTRSTVTGERQSSLREAWSTCRENSKDN